MFLALHYLAEWSLEPTNSLHQGRGKKEQRGHQNTYTAADQWLCSFCNQALWRARAKLYKFEVKMFISLSYSWCWLWNSIVQTSVSFLLVPNTDMSVRWQIPALPGVCGNGEWQSWLISEQWKQSISCCHQHSRGSVRSRIKRSNFLVLLSVCIIQKLQREVWCCKNIHHCVIVGVYACYILITLITLIV